MSLEGDPRRADHRRGDGDGERGGEAGAGPLRGGEWLDPLFRVVDAARIAVAVLAIATALVYVGARIEREIVKRGLRVVDGEDQKREAAHGDRR